MASALSACEGVIPLRFGTVTVAAGFLPLEKTRLTWVPFSHWVSRAGSWLMSLPSSMLSSYCSDVLTTKKPSPYSASLAVASSLVIPSRFGMALVAELPPMRAMAPPATSAIAAMTPITMAAILPLLMGFFSGTCMLEAWLAPVVGMRPVVVGETAALGMAWVRPPGVRLSCEVGVAVMSEVASPRFTMRPAR